MMKSPTPAEDRIPKSDEPVEQTAVPEAAEAADAPEAGSTEIHSEMEGIELDKTVFETADPLALLNFAPE